MLLFSSDRMKDNQSLNLVLAEPSHAFSLLYRHKREGGFKTKYSFFPASVSYITFLLPPMPILLSQM